jgi:DNA repair protein RadC
VLASYEEVYLRDGVFSLQRAGDYWSPLLEPALGRGYDGVRVVSDIDWLRREDWDTFIKYEAQLHRVLNCYRMVALCAFPFELLTLGEALAVSRNHHVTLFTGRDSSLILRNADENQQYFFRLKKKRRLTSLQQAFLTKGLGGLKEEEIVELLLSTCLTPRLAKKSARQYLKNFGSVSELLAASSEELDRMGVAQDCIILIRLLQSLPTEILRRKIVSKPICTSPQDVLEYLSSSMRELEREVLKVIYLNNRSEIVEIEDVFGGDISSVAINFRGIQESAIRNKASGIILVHNHPSGDPTPSRTDHQLTRDLIFTGIILQIKVLDHIIIGDHNYFSFKKEGLIEKYEDSFLNLKIRSTLVHADKPSRKSAKPSNPFVIQK